MPGKDRIWWYENFDNDTELSEFIIDLETADENGDFHFGFSFFGVPDQYKCLSTTFSGHIDNKTCNKEDIFHSIYDYFEIRRLYIEDTTNLPIYNQIYVYFYPFDCEDNNFKNEKIEYTFVDHYDGSYEVIFEHGEDTLMMVKLTKQSSSQIDKEKMINELILNYKIIV